MIAQYPVSMPKSKSSQYYQNLFKNRYLTFPAVGYFTWKAESASDILCMNVDSKFQLQQLWLFGKSLQKKYTSSRKHKKMIITIEFFIFELV